MDTTAKPLKRLDTWKKNPDPKSEPELAQQRIRQWRRYSRDPFESEKNGEGSNDNAPAQKPDNTRTLSSGSDKTAVGDGGISESKSSPSDAPEPTQSEPDGLSEIKHPELKHPGSSWVHLFYDLAWAASFASLTGSGKFDNPLDTVNYFMFFAAVLWLWTSHTLYSIHFYTNDWFHLISTFLQLFIFGMLAATTKGYDITNYIAHSPGMPKLRKSNNMDDLDPQEYTEERIAYLSMLVLAISFTATRIIQLVQYIRVLYYWGSTEPNPENQNNQNTTPRSWILRFRSWISRFRPWRSSLPPQLVAITIGLLISNPMFIAALGIAASNFGETVLGASLKLGLWVGGFLIEVVSHLSMPIHWWKNKQDITTINASDRKKRMLPTAPDVKLYERLQTITTIILGEGINGIAGTLSTVLAAPGIGRTVGINIVCAACTIWFIAYIYFEGPKGETSPALTSLRYLLWMILHLPFLVSTVLMLIGMKSQFLLTSFLSALFGTMDGFNRIRNEQLSGNSSMTYWRTNPEMKRFLLKRGIVWEKEFQKFSYAFGNATIEERPTVMPIWLQRFSLTVAVTLFKDFNGEDDSIPSDLQDIITGYYENSTQVIEDLKIIPTYPKDAVYYQILGGLLDGFVLSTRCVIGFAGLILISLGLQDFIHSWPSDRYQWGVIASRISMGLILCLLLLLNIGKYQDLFVATDKLNQRAGVFQWLEVFWVLPTIAIAYGLEYLVEMALAMSAKRVTVKTYRLTREKGEGSSDSKNNDPQESQQDPEKQQMT